MVRFIFITFELKIELNLHIYINKSSVSLKFNTLLRIIV